MRYNIIHRNNSGKKNLLRSFCFLVFVFIAYNVIFTKDIYAADTTWTGVVSADWADATNWSLSAVPTSADSVTIPDAGTTTYAPSISSGALCGSMTIAASGVLNGNGNTITTYGSWTNNGTFNHGNGNVIFVNSGNATFFPGASFYNNVGLNKSGDYGILYVSGTATIAGNFTQTDGEAGGGQFDLSGNYNIGAAADGVALDVGTATIINLNHPSNVQTINYSSGGVGSHIRIDKAGGSVTISSDIIINSWTYIKGTVSNLSAYKITFKGIGEGGFTPGDATYGSISVDKYGDDWRKRLNISTGTLNMAGSLDVVAGQLRLVTNNPVLNISGNITIGISGIVDAGTNPITVNGNWTNAGTFNHGSGTVKFIGNAFVNATFTPGGSAYNNIEISKTNSDGSWDRVFVSGTAIISGNVTHTDGRWVGGQIDLAGNYIIGASASDGVPGSAATIINFNHASNNQTISCGAGGYGTNVRIDKAGGTFTLSSNITIEGWNYVQGTVNNLTTYSITFGGTNGIFVPGNLTYGSIGLNKSCTDFSWDHLDISGVATVSGDFTHSDGRFFGSQINLGGNYIIGANAANNITGGTPGIVNFNHASNNQSVIYTAGGEGAHVRIDKAGGTFSLPGDITVSDWTYIQGTVSGINTHTITFTGASDGNFTPGNITYGNITINKANTDTMWDDLIISAGTLNLAGNLTVTDGELYLNTNNTTVSVTGSISIAAAGAMNAGTNTITVYGGWTNGGTFNHGNGKVTFYGSSGPVTFNPGASAYNNIEINKTHDSSAYDVVNVSGTATVAGDLTHTNGRISGGQINLAGNYTIGSSASGGTATTNFNHGSNNQAIVYSAGGIGSQVRIDKAGGNFTITSNIAVAGWTYVTGTVVGVNTYTITFGGSENGSFTPGVLTYNSIVVDKKHDSVAYDALTISGTASVSGNVTHVDGRMLGGQINLGGDYIIGSAAGGALLDIIATTINFNHASNNQSITYSAGGVGAQVRIDKAGGTFSIGSNVSVSGWVYITGTVAGVNTYTLTLGGVGNGTFTPGALTYGGITINKTHENTIWNDLIVSSGTLNISGSLTVTDGDLYLNTNNTTVNVTGNVSISAAGIMNAGTNTITVNGNWTNSGTFNHGNGKVKFNGLSSTFTPGASFYYEIELNKTNNSDNSLAVSGTATVSNNFTHTDGQIKQGQFNLAGNYIIGAAANGGEYGVTTTIINFNGAGAQAITYNASGAGAQIRVDKTGGTLTVSSDIIVVGWTYIQGTVVGIDTYNLILGDSTHGYFTPGSLSYKNIEVNKGTDLGYLSITGTANVSGNFTHTDGEVFGGQINLGGDYIIAASASGPGYATNATVINFNHVSNDQHIIYSAGGLGEQIRIDKTGGTLTVSSNIKMVGWTYIQGAVVGIDTYDLILGGATNGTFTPGNLVYKNIELYKLYDYDDLIVSAGTANISGNLILTDGELRLETNNPTINLGGNLSIASAATFTKGTSILTFNGITPSVITDSHATPQNLGKLAVNKTSATETQNRLTLASPLACNTLSIDGTSGQADTLDLGNGGYTLTLSSTGNTADVFTVNGTVIPGDSTIKYAATNSAGNINIAPASYDNLELSGTETYALSGTTALTGNLIIGANSTLLVGTNTLNLAGNITNSGTFTPGTSTVNLTGVNQSLSGNTTFYNLTKDITTSDTLTFAANSTTTINSSGTLTLKGQDRDNRLSLVSSTPDTQWNLAVNDDSTYDFDFLNVQDSNATTKYLSVLNSLDAGNNTNWTIVNNTATGITIPFINVAGSIVTIHTTASDTDHDNISLKIEYSIDNGSTWHDPYLSNVTSASGIPILNNASEYQITGITTASDNTVTILWDTRSEQNELLSILFENDIKIKLTPYDGTDVGSSQTSSPFEVNNRSAVFVPPTKPDLSDTEISSDNNILHFTNLPANITQIAISSTSGFQDISYQDINDIINLSDYATDTLYFKFRTSQGSTSDTITYNKVSHSISSDLKEGDIVKTKDNFDVYIIKYKGGKQYKRLILSPSVFNSYHHLKWENIKIVSQSEMDRYTTSNLVKETIDVTIFELFPNGDTGERRKLDISKPYDIDSVYEINRVDRDSYILVK